MVQAARKLQHAIRDAFCGEAQDLFDNAAAFDPGDGVLDDDTCPGEERVEERLTDAQCLACGLFWGCLVWVPAGSYPCKPVSVSSVAWWGYTLCASSVAFLSWVVPATVGRRYTTFVVLALTRRRFVSVWAFCVPL